VSRVIAAAFRSQQLGGWVRMPNFEFAINNGVIHAAFDR